MIQRWIWRDGQRRASRLLSSAETEADGGRDIARAAERTSDPVLRRLYLLHAADEQRHAELLRTRGTALLKDCPPVRGRVGALLAPGERGLDDLEIDRKQDDALLAFLHLSEKTAALRFAQYQEALEEDAVTRAVFAEILGDETFHMKYTKAQLTRIASNHHLVLWRARRDRLWKAYLRLAVAIAGAIGTVVLLIEYFVILPPFALLARRNARREPAGWFAITPQASLRREY